MSSYNEQCESTFKLIRIVHYNCFVIISVGYDSLSSLS